MTETAAPFEPRPAYTELHALACAMREDWSRDDLRDAMTAVHQAGWAWKDVFREVSRLAWAEDETPATLRNSARRPGPAPAAPLAPDLSAALRAGNYAAAWSATHDGAVPPRIARVTGGQPVLTEHDPRAGAVPATEPTESRK